jgi:hypothetical protein
MVRLIERRNAFEALIFAWKRLGFVFRDYWVALALGIAASSFLANARVPVLPLLVIDATLIVPLLVTANLAGLTPRLERQIVGMLLLCVPILLNEPSSALIHSEILAPFPANIILLISGVALYVLALKLLPLGFVYALGEQSIRNSFRRTWLVVSGRDCWNIFGIFFLALLCTIPALLIFRILSALHAPPEVALLTQSALVTSLGTWTFLALGAFSSTYVFDAEPPEPSEPREPGTWQKPKTLQPPPSFGKGDGWIW